MRLHRTNYVPTPSKASMNVHKLVSHLTKYISFWKTIRQDVGIIVPLKLSILRFLWINNS